MLQADDKNYQDQWKFLYWLLRRPVPSSRNLVYARTWHSKICERKAYALLNVLKYS